ncbi:MAG: FKBP-type peptidyl-prolyl cis-trans isomerase [Anaeromyxobacter sp.]
MLSAFSSSRNPNPQPGTPPAPPQSKADQEKALNIIGLSVAESLKPLALSPPELDKVLAGIRGGASGKDALERNEANAKLVSDFVNARQAAGAKKEAARGTSYLDKAAKEKGAEKLPSGVVVITQTAGTGAAPGATDVVKVHYVGTLVDGSVFDSSRSRGQPAEFPLNRVVPCWGQAFQKLKVGAKARIVCPSETAYGERGSPPMIPGNAVLTFDVELLEVKPPPPAAPGAPATP